MTQNLSSLPHSVQNLIQWIGWGPTVKLLEKRGGTAVYIPPRPEDAQAISYLIGPSAIASLCLNWGGKTRRLPKLDKLLIHKRNRAIREEAQSGASTKHLAERYALTDRMIQNILRAAA